MKREGFYVYEHGVWEVGHGSPVKDERNVESCAINPEDEQYAYKILQDVFFPRYSSIKHYSLGFLPKEDKWSNNIMKNQNP